MSTGIIFLFLLLLFIILGIAADVVVRNIKYIATVLKVRLFAFGIVLGLATSLPELSVGINAMMNEASSLSVGNLLGGIIVIFGLILGTSLIFNRSVETDGSLSLLLPQIVVILFPVCLGFDGNYGLIDGLIMIFAYLALIYYLYRMHRHFSLSLPTSIDRNEIIKAFFLAIGGIVFVVLASHWIVELTLKLVANLQIGRVAIGAVIFALGTNLPEVTIAISSWHKKSSELSLSHLLSSAFSNVLILGVLATIRTINFSGNGEFLIISIFTPLILLFYALFYRSEKKMVHWEGLVLLIIYFLFLGMTFWRA